MAAVLPFPSLNLNEGPTKDIASPGLKVKWYMPTSTFSLKLLLSRALWLKEGQLFTQLPSPEAQD